MEGSDADALKEVLPNFLLLEAIFETLFNQPGIKLRFAGGRISFLYFPKVSLSRTRFGQGLPEFVTPDDMHKLKTRKRVLQKFEIVRFSSAEDASFAQPGKEIVQIPTHQLKTEDFI